MRSPQAREICLNQPVGMPMLLLPRILVSDLPSLSAQAVPSILLRVHIFVIFDAVRELPSSFICVVCAGELHKVPRFSQVHSIVDFCASVYIEMMPSVLIID